MSMVHARPGPPAALLMLLCFATAVPCFAATDPNSPIGEWRTIDDATGAPRAVVKIYDKGGELFGLVEKPLMKEPGHPNCDDCTDDRRGKPIVGMDIIRSLHKDGDKWDGGTILDPENGKVYRCSITLKDSGQRLAVRGYIGFSLLGRTQVWERLN